MEPITVKYKVLDPRARTPAYATPGSAAADLCAVLDEPLTVQPMQRVLVPTGLAIELPGAHAVALVYARSGLSIKHGLCMANGVGVVDSDYRGELKVPMVNLGAEAYTIQPGERVAQLCIAPVYTAAFVQADALDETARGEGGFGSTVVPRLVGFPLKEAKGRLWELGLNVGKIDFDEGINLLNQKDARVYVQVPTAERSAALGSRVDLKLTLDEKKLAQHRATAEKQAREAAEERLRLERERADSLAQAEFEQAAAAGEEQPEILPATDNDGFFD